MIYTFHFRNYYNLANILWIYFKTNKCYSSVNDYDNPIFS